MESPNISLGHYSDMSNADYHAAPGISASHLRHAGRAAVHYWADYLDPKRKPKERTPALILGDAIHQAVLQPDLFDENFFMRPDGIDGRTKSGKLELADLMAEAAGRTILTADDFTTLRGIRDAVYRHPVAAGLLSGGVAEQSYFVRDAETGALVKCRPDYRHRNGIVVDLKSTEDASPVGFGISTRKYWYDVASAHYCDVLAAHFGEPPPHFVFLAVEKSWPFAIGIYFVEPDVMAAARVIARASLHHVIAWREASAWPDYGITPRPLRVPPRAA